MNGDAKSFRPVEVTAPRLVLMKKGDQGYGFNLHGEKGVQGQTISAVDKGSPAELGGLRESDRVIEVNGYNVEDMRHGEVVGKIKENPAETRLLVIDRTTDNYLRAHGRKVTADMANLSTVYESAVLKPEPTPPSVEVEPEPSPAPVEPSEPAPAERPPSEPAAPEPAVVMVDAPPPVESAPPQTEPEIPPESSPKDAIDQINNVLEQEEQKPAEPDPNEAEAVRRRMEAARPRKNKPGRIEVKQRTQNRENEWTDMKNKFDRM